MKAKRRARRDCVSAGQVQRSIVYLDHNHQHDKRSITVERAAGIVALRTGTAYNDVRVVLSVSPSGPADDAN